LARSIAQTLTNLKPFIRLKHFLPKTLFGRSLVILITPIILVQLITGFVFWDRHWAKHTERMADQICSNIASLIDMANSIPEQPGQMDFIERFAQTHYGITLVKHSPFEKFDQESIQGDTWRERLLAESLSERISYPFRVKVLSDTIRIQVATLHGVFDFSLNKRILFSKSTPVMIWWEIGAPLFFIFIAFIFMRNQMRPLKTLSEAVERFGKGREVAPIKPSGALEIRRVGRSFNEMRERIQRQISQRTEMLAGISHDLKTPLTRMELQLAMLKKSAETKSLLVDVKEMEKMVEEYLAFARGEEAEIATDHDLYLLLQEVLKRFDTTRVEFAPLPEKLPFVPLRPYAFMRALKNLVSNALRYGNHVWIQLSASPKTLTLIMDDNGPGIPADKREEVFRPFVRLDKSRNAQTGGYGLGLAITKDIITAHGGTIMLDDSPQGGLRVVVNLPV
jgi:two-component system osmolarity sensor histidine kinase EnvZ